MAAKKKADKPSPKLVRARKLVGRFMGLLNRLGQKRRAHARKLWREKGSDAAIRWLVKEHERTA